MEETGKSMSLSVPMAIIIAGLMVAGAVYFSGNNSNQSANVANSQADEIASTDFNIAPLSNTDYVRGNPNAKVVMIEYSDTECPFCKQFHSTVKGLADKLGKDGTFAWAYRNFPIKERHPKAPLQAEALLCAGKIGGQAGFWSYTDEVYATTPANNGLADSQLPIIAEKVGLDVAVFNACLSSGEMTARVNTEADEAKNNGAGGTPYSIFVVAEEYNRKSVEQFLAESIVKYKFPAEFFLLSNDNKKIGVSGSMPEQFLTDLVAVLTK